MSFTASLASLLVSAERTCVYRFGEWVDIDRDWLRTFEGIAVVLADETITLPDQTVTVYGQGSAWVVNCIGGKAMLLRFEMEMSTYRAITKSDIRKVDTKGQVA